MITSSQGSYREIVDCCGTSFQQSEESIRSCHYLLLDFSTPQLRFETNLPEMLEKEYRHREQFQGQFLVVIGNTEEDEWSKRCSQRIMETILSQLKNYFSQQDSSFMMKQAGNAASEMQVGSASSRLSRVLESCDLALREETDREGLNRPLSAVVTLVHLEWPYMNVVHAGDSRCYVHRHLRIRQLTKDHTVAQKMVEEGILSPDQAKTSRWKNALYNVLGGEGKPVQLEVKHHRQLSGDTILCCTEGLLGSFSESEIAAILRQGNSAEECCRLFHQAAEKKESAENFSLIVARLQRNVARRAGKERDRNRGSSFLQSLSAEKNAEEPNRSKDSSSFQASNP
ncbi:Hypothetical protein PBC10988_41250 [Planctomycetales bacterium 10988]|nr:Hypothetical protein PBC10988_41250 [Planctomycetales bacterium 10988]